MRTKIKRTLCGQLAHGRSKDKYSHYIIKSNQTVNSIGRIDCMKFRMGFVLSESNEKIRANFQMNTLN